MQAPSLAKPFHAFNTTCKNHAPKIIALTNEILIGGVDLINSTSYDRSFTKKMRSKVCGKNNIKVRIVKICHLYDRVTMILLLDGPII